MFYKNYKLKSEKGLSVNGLVQIKKLHLLTLKII